MVSAVREAAAVNVLTACRVCDGELTTLYTYRSMPLANAYCPQGEHDCWRYPLTLARCTGCGLVQIREEVAREVLYSEYAYIPSTSKTLVAHFADLATSYAKEGMSVVDIGSNDGTLLKEFQARGCTVLGYEPATNIAEMARADGVPTANAYFNGDGSAPDLITATNVVANTTDLRGFLQAVYDSLGDGQFVMETPDFWSLTNRGRYDTVYHEHMCYFDRESLEATLWRCGLVPERIERVEMHGGSWRATCRRGEPRVIENVDDDRYRFLGTNADRRAERIYDTLRQFHQEGKRVVGYGAPAKATVLLGQADVKPEWIEYIVDSIPFKQGKYLPGLHIPIKPESELGNPDMIFILTWNFEDEIRAKLKGHPAKVVCL